MPVPKRPARILAAALSTLLAAAGLAAIGGQQSAVAADASIYASPTGTGTSCTKSAPCAITQAKAEAAARAAAMTGDINVVLADGTYRVSSPLTFTAKDSGQNGHRIVWQPAEDAKPVISGGTPVTGWTRSTANPDLWSAPVASGLETRQLYAADVRLPRSSGMPSGLKFSRTSTGYTASNNTLSTWKNPQNIELVYDDGNGDWTQPRCGIASVSNTTITMRQPCWGNLTPPTGPKAWDGANPSGNFPGTRKAPSRLENAYELLAPGQWYLDQSADRVYYYPKAGEVPSKMQFTAPQTEQLLISTATPDAPLHDVTFRNIEFAHTTWLQPSSNAGFAEMQANMTMTTSNTQGLCGYSNPAGSCPFAAWTRPLAAVDFTGTRNVSFLKNKFHHLGGAGLGLFHGATSDTVRGNEFTDVSSNGIQLGATDDPQPPASYATDVARGKTATQSSTLRGFGAPAGGATASLAVDGNTDGDFSHGSVSHTNSDVNAWWQVDLGSSHLLDSIKVFNRTDCCASRDSDYWVFVSDSPFDTTLTPVQQAAKSGVWSSHQTGQAGSPTVIPADATGRYVMVQLSGTDHLALAEVQAISRDPEIATGNTISNNYVHNTGAEFTGAVGIFVGYTRNTTISHNQLNDLPYSGISLGWGGWHTSASRPDDNPNINADNTISNNLIFNVMKTRSDGGAIYTNGRQGTSFAHGLTISGNVTFGNTHTNNAYYTDEGGRYVTIDGNIQYLDGGRFTGGCSTSGPIVVKNSYYVGVFREYGCFDPGPASSFPDDGSNKLIAQNPLPGVLPTGTLEAAGLEHPYTRLTTSSAPVVRVVSPISSGQILLSGSGFTPASKVKISGTPATKTTYISSNYLTATLPAGTVAGNVTVTTAAGTSAITSASFTYDPSKNKNIARGKTAAQSSTYTDSGTPAGGATASLAVDGNPDGDFGHGSVSHTNSDVNAWWQVDLGSSHLVNVINVFNRTDCCASRLSDYWVFVSDSPFDTTLTPVQQAAKSGVWSSHQTGQAGSPTVIPADATGRYVMVQLSGTNYLALGEVEVLG
ncbi:discoidin domain-containing protein [Streptomyces sp. NPDC057565]|uniref:galactose-binding domain-containing protein n=1 Tax=Streptomyces sp. NPDC057565 TaxID=3346169 RepID=UPI00369E845A